MTPSVRRMKMTAAGGVAVATLLVALLIVSYRDDPAATAVAPSGEEVTVTPDSIELGERLVGMSVAKANGQLYVLAGHYRSQTDRYFTPKASVLVAFDDEGAERWRTDVDRRPSDIVLIDGDPWIIRGDSNVSRVDGSSGRLLEGPRVEHIRGLVSGFGSAWLTSQEGTEDGLGPGRLLRIDADDLSTTSVDVPLFVGDCHDGDVDPPDEQGWCPGAATVGANAVWVPLKNGGVAMIDPDTDQVTVIPVDVIGHEVLQVAVDHDVAYVASRDRVTSIVDGRVRGSISLGPVRYLGRMDGVFGAQLASGEFVVLGADAPMAKEYRRFSDGARWAKDIDGEAWTETGWNYSLRRVELLPLPSEG